MKQSLNNTFLNHPTRTTTKNEQKPKFKFKKCNKCYGKRKYLNEFNECKSCENCKKCKYQRRDYLNELQICNSCCKQMELMTPSGFRPNFKFESCERCSQHGD